MEAELTFSPDHVLSHTDQVIATSDGIVLDRCQRWANLVRLIIAERIPQARLLDLSTSVVEGKRSPRANPFNHAVEVHFPILLNYQSFLIVPELLPLFSLDTGRWVVIRTITLAYYEASHQSTVPPPGTVKSRRRVRKQFNQRTGANWQKMNLAQNNASVTTGSSERRFPVRNEGASKGLKP